MIRALLETARDFHRVRRAKVIVGVSRDNLIEPRVFRKLVTWDFKRKSYENDFVLRWTRARLTEVLDRRINFLFGPTTQRARVASRTYAS